MATSSNADSQVIWMDGKLVPYDEARIHILTHSFHYGTAAFEGIRAYETVRGESAIFRGPEHMKRFCDSMKTLGYDASHTPLDFLKAACDTVRANGFKECYLRPVAYIDDSFRGLKLPSNPPVRSAIAVWKWGKYMGDEGHSKGIRLMISSLRRPDVSTSMTFAKLSGNYLTSVMARREATLHGFDEALLLDPNGFVAEGSGENIFIVKDGVLSTPPAGFILPGITRNSVMQIAKDQGYTIREEAITRNQLYLADEAFFTGTAVEITPIREVDGHSIGAGRPGPVSKKISDEFFKCVRGESSKYKEWLTIV